MNDRLNAALQYVQHGWFVIPLNPGKKIIVADLYDRLGIHGDGATCSEFEVRRWFDIEPAINIGIALGPSHLTVMDVDHLDEALDWFTEHDSAEFWAYAVALTPHGKHYYFRVHREDACGVVYGGERYLGDFLTGMQPRWNRHERPYVVAPPSVIIDPAIQDATLYTWENAFNVTLGYAPDWLREAVIEPIEPHSWIDPGPFDDEDDAQDEWADWDWADDMGLNDPDPEQEERERIVAGLLEQRFGTSEPPEDFDIADLYQRADEIMAGADNTPDGETQL